MRKLIFAARIAADGLCNNELFIEHEEIAFLQTLLPLEMSYRITFACNMDMIHV